MNGQDEENRRIYNQGDFTKNRRTIRKTLGSSIGGVLGEEKKKSFSAEDRGRALTFPPDDPVTQRSHPIVEGVLTKAQLGLDLGLLTSTVKGAPQNGTLQFFIIKSRY